MQSEIPCERECVDDTSRCAGTDALCSLDEQCACVCFLDDGDDDDDGGSQGEGEYYADNDDSGGSTAEVCVERASILHYPVQSWFLDYAHILCTVVHACRPEDCAAITAPIACYDSKCCQLRLGAWE